MRSPGVYSEMGVEDYPRPNVDDRPFGISPGKLASLGKFSDQAR